MLTFLRFEMTVQAIYNIPQGFVSVFHCFLGKIEMDIFQIFSMDLFIDVITYC